MPSNNARAFKVGVCQSLCFILTLLAVPVVYTFFDDLEARFRPAEASMPSTPALEPGAGG